MVVAAATVGRHLDEVLDVIADAHKAARGLRQARAHAHVVARTASQVQQPHVRRLEAILAELDARLDQRTDALKGAAGHLDQLNRDLRRAERARGGSGLMRSKVIAERARGPLAVLGAASYHTDARVESARRVLDELVAQVPTVQLLNAGVRHELGAEQYERLADYHAASVAQEAAA